MVAVASRSRELWSRTEEDEIENRNNGLPLNHRKPGLNLRPGRVSAVTGLPSGAMLRAEPGGSGGVGVVVRGAESTCLLSPRDQLPHRERSDRGVAHRLQQ